MSVEQLFGAIVGVETVIILFGLILLISLKYRLDAQFIFLQSIYNLVQPIDKTQAGYYVAQLHSHFSSRKNEEGIMLCDAVSKHLQRKKRSPKNEKEQS